LLLYVLDTESAISDVTASPIAVASCSQKTQRSKMRGGDTISHSCGNAENAACKGLGIFIERYSNLLVP
jgi:hypothetical protein